MKNSCQQNFLGTFGASESESHAISEIIQQVSLGVWGSIYWPKNPLTNLLIKYNSDFVSKSIHYGYFVKQIASRKHLDSF